MFLTPNQCLQRNLNFVLEDLVKFQVIVNLVIDVFKNKLSLSIDVTVRVCM